MAAGVTLVAVLLLGVLPALAAALRRFLGFAACHGNEAVLRTLEILHAYKVTPARQVDAKPTAPVSRETYAVLRERSGAHYRSLWDVLWWTGARISEVLGDVVTGIPPLSGADVLALVERGHVQTQGKGGKWRTLVLPPKGREIPCAGSRPDWTASCRSRRSRSSRRPSTPPCTASESPAAPTVSDTHSAPGLRQAGVSEELMARLMGHGPRNVTDGYGAAGIEELLAVIERLS